MTQGKKCLFWLTIPGYSQCPVAGRASGQEHGAEGHITATVKKQKKGMNDIVHIAFSFPGPGNDASHSGQVFLSLVTQSRYFLTGMSRDLESQRVQ